MSVFAAQADLPVSPSGDDDVTLHPRRSRRNSSCVQALHFFFFSLLAFCSLSARFLLAFLFCSSLLLFSFSFLSLSLSLSCARDPLLMLSVFRLLLLPPLLSLSFPFFSLSYPNLRLRKQIPGSNVIYIIRQNISNKFTLLRETSYR